MLARDLAAPPAPAARSRCCRAARPRPPRLSPAPARREHIVACRGLGWREPDLPGRRCLSRVSRHPRAVRGDGARPPGLTKHVCHLERLRPQSCGASSQPRRASSARPHSHGRETAARQLRTCAASSRQAGRQLGSYERPWPMGDEPQSRLTAMSAAASRVLVPRDTSVAGPRSDRAPRLQQL